MHSMSKEYRGNGYGVRDEEPSTIINRLAQYEQIINEEKLTELQQFCLQASYDEAEQKLYKTIGLENERFNQVFGLVDSSQWDRLKEVLQE